MVNGFLQQRPIWDRRPSLRPSNETFAAERATAQWGVGTTQRRKRRPRIEGEKGMGGRDKIGRVKWTDTIRVRLACPRNLDLPNDELIGMYDAGPSKLVKSDLRESRTRITTTLPQNVGQLNLLSD